VGGEMFFLFFCCCCCCFLEQYESEGRKGMFCVFV
jgi:hypothetical protein